jgi:hypothetical protein
MKFKKVLGGKIIMKIWGYSERGVMNALFYGIAFGKQNLGRGQTLLRALTA